MKLSHFPHLLIPKRLHTKKSKVFVSLIPAGYDVTEADISHKMEINLPPLDRSLRQPENLIIHFAFLILTIPTTLEFSRLRQN